LFALRRNGHRPDSGRERAIRLLYFINSPETPGGVEEHVFSLMASLPPDRFHIALVCPAAVYDMFAPLVSSTRRIFRLDLYRLAQTGAMAELARIVRALKPDIAHSHQFFATFFMAPIAKLCRVPIVVETTHLREAWRRSWLKRSYIIDRLVYRTVDCFVAVSKAGARHLIECKHCPEGKVVQIYNGRDVTRFRPDPTTRASVRRELGLTRHDPLIVHVGRLSPQKGHRYLLDAMPVVLHHLPRTKLAIVGDGELRPQLEAEVARRVLGSSVVFTGFQSSVTRLLDAADVVVLPSLFEGLPLTAIEAAAMGKPLVASSVDGTPEVVDDGHTGLLVPPADSVRLAEALVTLLKDEPRRAAMGAAARRLVEERFDLGQHVARHVDLYESLFRRSASTKRRSRR
jgi:glycosyltransferase involved in cell wall biosynthesis